MTNALLNRLLGLLFPDRCGGCKHIGELLCARCQSALAVYPHEHYAPPPNLSSIQVGFVFQSPLREAIHHFKYRSVQRMAEPLGALLVKQLRLQDPETVAVLAVPLHPTRLAERGFNQAEALARVVAQHLGQPFIGEGLVRLRGTEQQARLDARQRAENMRGAFGWRGAVPPAHVLLVDDVYTTGATMNACAAALRSAGTQEIYGVALARSRPQKQ